MDRPPFITGSCAYGTSTAESDLDLVVLVSREVLAILKAAAELDPKHVESTNYGDMVTGVPLRFGKCNLICCVESNWYDVWVEGTKALQEVRPVSRDDAIAKFKSLRRKEWNRISDEALDERLRTAGTKV